MKTYAKIIIFTLILFNMTGCLKKQYKKRNGDQQTKEEIKPWEKQLLEIEEKCFSHKVIKQQKIPYGMKKHELDFQVKNETGKSIYLVCFSYIKKRPFARWRWDKSPVYHLNNNEMVTIDIDTIGDTKDRKNVYAYLAILKTQQAAEESIYELLNDKDKIDIDKLYKLKDKKLKVIIGIEKYGFKEDILDYKFVPKEEEEEEANPPELDFLVENKTGKTIYVTCFVYQKQKDETIWQYDKTPLIKLKAFLEVELTELLKFGQVGDVLTHYFNSKGEFCELSIYKRLVNFPLNSLKEVEEVIAVAGGINKKYSIIGALRSGLIDTIILDSITAQEIIKEV